MTIGDHVGERVEIIYQDRNGRFTKRRIEIIGERDGKVTAYCLASRGIRMFRCEQILAAVPERRRA